jgi:predicted phage baseplate assembly protein
LGVVPTDTLLQVLTNGGQGGDGCRRDREVLAPARFRPLLGRGPLTQAVPYDPSSPPLSAREVMRFDANEALPEITLHDGTSQPWECRPDLLSSRAIDRHFVVEVEADGRGRIRFGDGRFGERPAAGRMITARYRVGNGRPGNIGAAALAHVVTDEDGIDGVVNPVAALGGVDLETVEEVRQHAPVAFRPQTMPGLPGRPDGRSLSRAVTAADYAAVAETDAAVQRAAATFRWTGSWRTVSVTVDRLGGDGVTAAFEGSLRQRLERYRMAGHDLEIEPPRPVPLELEARIQVKPGYFAQDVRRELLDAFSSRVLPDGRRGVFHPDNLTFGQTIYLSPLYAAAQAVDGVAAVDITTFQRRDQPGPTALDEGRLVLGRLEIARLDNDPNFPERGVLTVRVEEAT